MTRVTSLVLGLFLLGAFSTEALADTYVKGYQRKNGTYVQPHFRSSPDKSYNNNYSVRPNVNPYTGRRGTRAPTFNNRAPSTNSFGTRNSFGAKPRRSNGLWGR